MAKNRQRKRMSRFQKAKARFRRWLGTQTRPPVTEPPTTPSAIPPSPDPMEWLVVPTALSSTSIWMEAETATALLPNGSGAVQYYFENETDNTHDSGWQESPTYIDEGLDPATSYAYNVKARTPAPHLEETAASTSESESTNAAPDVTAPTPNPAEWDQVPFASSSTAIEMSAGVGSDTSTPIEYFFESVSGGGNDSGWQASEAYTDSGLIPSTAYSYRVKMRDSLGNETEWSTTETATTDADADVDPPTPDPAQFLVFPTAQGDTSIAMRAVTGFDISTPIEYYFDATTAGGHDSGWQESRSYTDTGLSPLTAYGYRVKMRDAEGNETAYSAVATATTTGTADTTPPTPNPATWSVEPVAISSSAITMTATTGTDANGPVEYSFEPVTQGPGQVASGWQTSATYTNSGLQPQTSYNWIVRMRDALGNVGAYSVARSATTNAIPDASAPTPNPSTWSTNPTALSSTEVTMTASAASDPSTPVEYSFEAVSGSGGSSGWQVSRTWIATGLTPATAYTWRHRTRDALGNTGSYSSTQGTTTAAAPGPGTAPSLTSITVPPESNGDTTPMLWPNLVGLRSTVNGNNLATTVTLEVSMDAGFSDITTYSVARGSITATQATTGARKVGAYVWDLVPGTNYWARFKAINSAGTSYSPTYAFTTPAIGATTTSLIDLIYDSLTFRSATELRPYWRGETHQGRRFAWKYELATDAAMTNIIASQTMRGFYDGPGTPSGSSQPRAEFKQSFTGLSPDTTYWIRLTTYNRAGPSTSTQSFATEPLTSTGGVELWKAAWTPDQKVPVSHWGQLPSDFRDPLSAPLSVTKSVVWGADEYDGDHNSASTTGEDAYTVYVDSTGYTTMWDMVFTASVDHGQGAGNGNSNINKAIRALKGIGGIVRVANDSDFVYNLGDVGGQSGSGSAPDTRFEAWWDNGLATSNPNHRYYPVTGVRVQAASAATRTLVSGNLILASSHGAANGIYYKGFDIHHPNVDSRNSAFAVGYSCGGMVGFYNCDWFVDPTDTRWADYGIDWHIKGTGNWSWDIRNCRFCPAHEHSAYVNSPGALGGVDSFFVNNEVLRDGGYNLNNAKSNGRTMFQCDSRGDLVAAGNQVQTQTGLAPGRGTLWFVGNRACNGSGPTGGGAGGKGLSVPGHRGKVVVMNHTHLSDPDGNDFGFMNTVEDPSKGAWLNENGFAVNEVEIHDVAWQVSDTIANMYINQGTETISVLERPSIVMNNRVAFAFTESNQPFPRSSGMATFSWAGTADNALRTDSAWPANLSAGNKVKYQFNTNSNGTVLFDDSGAGQTNFNTLSKGFVFEAIV